MNMPSGHFCGIRLKSDLVSNFTLLESLYLPNQRHSKHSHERATFCLVLQGRFTETHGRDSLACVPSTLLFYPAGETHSESFHNLRSRCFVIELKPTWLERLDDFSALVNQPADFHGGVRERVFRLGCRMVRSTSRQKSRCRGMKPSKVSSLSTPALIIRSCWPGLLSKNIKSWRRSDQRCRHAAAVSEERYRW